MSATKNNYSRVDVFCGLCFHSITSALHTRRCPRRKREVACGYCRLVVHETELIRHEKESCRKLRNFNKRPHQCCWCNRLFDKHKELKLHVALEHDEMTIVRNQPKQDSKRPVARSSSSRSPSALLPALSRFPTQVVQAPGAQQLPRPQIVGVHSPEQSPQVSQVPVGECRLLETTVPCFSILTHVDKARRLCKRG